MLTVEQAIEGILNSVTQSTSELIGLGESPGRVLADDLTTPHDSPPFDKSMMDGFAVSSVDGNADAQTLQVLETITAGTVPGKTVHTGTASRIMTGAPIPSGADCVVPIESVDFDEARPDIVTVRADDIAADKNVLRQGFATQAGEPLMAKGTRLEPQHIAVLAEFGVADVSVFRTPRVAVLATGDELLPIDQPLTPGKIRNSNEPMLAAQIARAGAIPVPLGVAKDRQEELRKHITAGLECDFLIMSGGVSAGTLDLVPSVLQAAGVRQVFHKIQMKPGKPLWFGQLESADRSCWVFGLPGNPVSSMVCFEVFVRTALRKFTGVPSPEPQYLNAALTEPVTVKGDRPTYFPCQLEMTDSGYLATPVPWGGSADLRSTADANGVCRLASSPEPYKAGDSVPTLAW